jgi:hypothetical protein
MAKPGSHFDQRPGEFEATRELWPLVLITHDADEGWQITVINGANAVRLSAAEAWRLRKRLADALAEIEAADV